MFKFKRIKLLALFTLAITLSGCASMFSDDARCPFTEQGGCQSVDQVNQMISEGRFSANGEYVEDEKKPLDVDSDNRSIQQKSYHVAWSGFNSPTPYSGQPLRTEEIDARLWVAPWQDEDNNYHGSSYITFVVEESHWSSLPQKEITENDYDDVE
ncbi:type IV conjugative transfer system lipoprotein TraV [Thiotrichales bacterium 19S11-10]|nr:type IV conjugative transfer system lipoprotein TraV [Thiotrichales bacterium 19S11-10]MCF6808561.1 type IV conjugative transfer system lipoprotein TraV [Thiotrichales bacterium 19S9-11]MCF6812531.1 type IV conjugative transfer system lipoprotein TraV [Thiotrichales bacterium 19S9-12]